MAAVAEQWQRQCPRVHRSLRRQLHLHQQQRCQQQQQLPRKLNQRRQRLWLQGSAATLPPPPLLLPQPLEAITNPKVCYQEPFLLQLPAAVG
jgi:hypothetical protein